MGIESWPLEFVTALQLPIRETLQSIARLDNGQFLVTQAYDSGVASEHGIVSLLNPDGSLESSMRLYRAGHLSSFAVRERDGEVYFYCIWNKTDVRGKTVASPFVEVRYNPTPVMGYATLISPEVTNKDSALTNGWTGAAFDEAKGLVCLRRRTEPTKEFFELRGLEDFLAGKGALLGRTPDFPSGTGVTPVMQSYAIEGATLYRLTGNSDQSDPTTLRVFDFNHETSSTIRLPTLGGSGSRREPEGLFLHRPDGTRDGTYSLYVGVTTRDSQKNYVSMIYRLSSLEETPMRSSVQNAWYDNISRYEASQGPVNWLYFDTHKPPLATTGIGNMIDSGKDLTDWGKGLGWKTKDGHKATPAQIQAEYDRLKRLNITGSGYAYKSHAQLFLDQSVVEYMCSSKRDEFWAILARQFPDIDKWPADAQLGIMNLAWWTGPNNFASKGWPTTSKHLNAGDFFSAADELLGSATSERTRDTVVLFDNAGMAAAAGINRDALWTAKKHPTFTWLGTRVVDARTGVSVTALKNAKPAVADLDAWYVQRMLGSLKLYTLALDGQFGPKSKAAYAAYCKKQGVPNTYTKPTLQALSNASKLYLTAVS